MFVPAPLEVVSTTVYIPGVLYICVGFCSVEKNPSPKSRYRNVGVLVVESVNITVNGAGHINTLPEKAVTGAKEDTVE